VDRGSCYIAFEGAEGCGKSTHAARLADDLDAVLTRETGGTPIGSRIRAILHDTAVTNLADRAEALLTAADRAQHLEEVVLPALAASRHVVSDRTVYSTLAYQGYGRGLDVQELRHINGWAIGGTWPHLVLLLDVHPDVQAARMHGRELDRFERETDTFHGRVRDGFAHMAGDDPDHWVTIDANDGVDQVYERIRNVVRDRLGI